MKISKLIFPIYAIAVFLIILLLGQLKVENFIRQIQYTALIIDFINIILSLIIFIQINRYSQKKFMFLPISIILLFLMDISFIIVFFINFHEFLVFALTNFSWYISAITGLTLLLTIYIYERKEIKLIIFIFIVITLIIISFFAPTYLRYLSFPYYSIDLTATITLFYLSMLIIIATKNKSILLGFSGFCFGMIGNYIMTECYLNNKLDNLVYGEIMWLINVLLISFSLINVIKFKLYNPKDWFVNSKSIRSKQAFIIFHISILGYILACIFMKEFNVIVEDNFVFIPSMGMIYSLIAAILSVILGKQAEKPFLAMKENIYTILNNNKVKNNEFNLIEFKEVQDYLMETYEYITYFQKQVISVATRVAHDVKSPILIMENLIKNWSNQNTDQNINFDKLQIIKQINKISYISRSMLKEHKDFNDEFYGIQCVFNIANDVIADKQIEWANENQIIFFNYNSNEIIWLSNEQAKIKNVLSNILNNSYEANTIKNKKINLIINADETNIFIQIQDFGCGIPNEEIDNILAGKSLKLQGNGIGLSSAKKFIESINGQLSIDSIVNQGTTVNIKFPMVTFPEQYTRNIVISTQKVIIVDDNSNIINIWQEYFLFNKPNIDAKYFINFFLLRDYLISQNNIDSITFLLDYSIFGEKLTGVDIIKEFNLKNVYLITDYAEDIKLQDETNQLRLKLVPKTMLQILLKNKDIS
ncbi:MAG TPA: sensor histidine kinase [Burkholderiales bacterium]|nr:sensor histidine kinase [Burkholderiales bacterium]